MCITFSVWQIDKEHDRKRDIMKLTKNGKIVTGLLITFLIIFTYAMAATNHTSKMQEDIVILFTNDVHCGIEENIGYAGVSAYKDIVEEKTPYVTLVDCGDAIQGDTIGTVSKGEFLVDLMNKADYDLAVLGNHEFDYGMEQLGTLIEKAQAQYLSCNISYTGSGENRLASVKPYEILTYGTTDVAFIGATTPNSITSSTPTYFMDEDGNYVYDFCRGNAGQDLYDCIQKNVDECLEAGAEYVVLLSHLGDGEAESPYTSVEVVENTSGIAVVLDAHSHSTISCMVLEDEDGEEVLLASTGTKLANMGQLVISPSGNITTSLISYFDKKDAEMETRIAEIKASYETELAKVMATADLTLSCNDENGIRMIRNRETAIGNFCADAYRAVAQADIAVVNGGGIRADLTEGEITYADLIAIHPFGNTLCKVTATGQEILDALEMASQLTENERTDGKNALGEDGSFLHVSGMKYTIDTSVEPSVELDENGNFIAVTGERRVKDVYVETEEGTLEALDPNREYTFASHNYLIKNGGGGSNMFMDNELLINEGALDYEVLITYMTDVLEGKLGDKYAATEGRITIK